MFRHPRKRPLSGGTNLAPPAPPPGPPSSQGLQSLSRSAFLSENGSVSSGPSETRALQERPVWDDSHDQVAVFNSAWATTLAFEAASEPVKVLPHVVEPSFEDDNLDFDDEEQGLSPPSDYSGNSRPWSGSTRGSTRGSKRPSSAYSTASEGSGWCGRHRSGPRIGSPFSLSSSFYNGPMSHRSLPSRESTRRAASAAPFYAKPPSYLHLGPQQAAGNLATGAAKVTASTLKLPLHLLETPGPASTAKRFSRASSAPPSSRTSASGGSGNRTGRSQSTTGSRQDSGRPGVMSSRRREHFEGLLERLRQDVAEAMTTARRKREEKFIAVMKRLEVERAAFVSALEAEVDASIQGEDRKRKELYKAWNRTVYEPLTEKRAAKLKEDERNGVLARKRAARNKAYDAYIAAANRRPVYLDVQREDYDPFAVSA